MTRKAGSGIITHIKGIDEDALNDEVHREPGRVRAGGGVFKSHHFRAGVPNLRGARRRYVIGAGLIGVCEWRESAI